MNEFKNRVGSNLNKRILKVDKVERNEAGEIEKLYVSITRNDSPYENGDGTPLNAATLNGTINNMINSQIKKALENYHENGLALLETAEATVLADGSCAQEDTILISTEEAVSIYVVNENSDLFVVFAPEESEKGTFEVVIHAIQDPEPSGATEYDFTVKLYSKKNNDMVKKVTCTVTFQAPSSTPED